MASLKLPLEIFFHPFLTAYVCFIGKVYFEGTMEAGFCCVGVCVCVFQWASMSVFTDELRPFTIKIVTERCLLVCVISFVFEIAITGNLPVT